MFVERGQTVILMMTNNDSGQANTMETGFKALILDSTTGGVARI